MGRKATPIKERLMKRVIYVPSGCWEFRGKKNKLGYGIIEDPISKETLAHRISFMIFRSMGTPIKNLCVLHRCDNPPCINPNHLFPGTRQLNNLDKLLKGRNITPNKYYTHCKRGHEFTKENTGYKTDGRRKCKLCVKIRYKEYRIKGKLNEK